MLPERGSSSFTWAVSSSFSTCVLLWWKMVWIGSGFSLTGQMVMHTVKVKLGDVLLLRVLSILEGRFCSFSKYWKKWSKCYICMHSFQVYFLLTSFSYSLSPLPSLLISFLSFLISCITMQSLTWLIDQQWLGLNIFKTNQMTQKMLKVVLWLPGMHYFLNLISVG